MRINFNNFKTKPATKVSMTSTFYIFTRILFYISVFTQTDNMYYFILYTMEYFCIIFGFFILKLKYKHLQIRYASEYFYVAKSVGK